MRSRPCLANMGPMRRDRGNPARAVLLLAVLLPAILGCASPQRLDLVQPVAPAAPEAFPRDARAGSQGAALQALFASPDVGFRAGTADPTRRLLGRLQRGYAADTLNVIIMGDNRPAFRSVTLKPNLKRIEKIASLNPLDWALGLVNVPILLFRGTIPDLKLWRDIPDMLARTPSYGREEQVLAAVNRLVDELEDGGQEVACVVNSGDLVEDGRYAKQWRRFLEMTRPLSDRGNSVH